MNCLYIICYVALALVVSVFMYIGLNYINRRVRSEELTMPNIFVISVIYLTFQAVLVFSLIALLKSLNSYNYINFFVLLGLSFLSVLGLGGRLKE